MVDPTTSVPVCTRPAAQVGTRRKGEVALPRSPFGVHRPAPRVTHIRARRPRTRPSWFTLFSVGVAPADLRQSEVLGCLPGEALDALAGSARPRRYAAGET